MINLSPAATSEIRRMQSKHQNANAGLRIGVCAGGCEDLTYTIELESLVKEGDRVYDCDGIEVVVDRKQLDYLEGLRLDYSEDMMGGGFRFENPKALKTCGCGNSFSMEKS